MKVAQVTFGYEPPRGGGDLYAAHLAQFFRDAGWEHRVFQYAQTARNREVRGVGSAFPGVRGAFWGEALRLARMGKTFAGFDVVVAHYPVYVLAVQRARRRGRPRLIGFSHGVTWDDKPTALRSRLKKELARRAFAVADVFVANDTHFLREMGVGIAPGTRLFERTADRAWFIPNAVDPALFRAAEPLRELARFAPVLVPRNLYANRGVHLAVEAFARFARRNPECFLVIVGHEGQRAYATRVKKRVSELGLFNRTIFHGWVPPHAMPAIYGAARLTLIPSIAGEGTSLAALESMAAGVATISTNIGGLADLPTHQCEPTVEALAAAMAEVYADRLPIGARQQEQVCDTFSLDRWRAAWQAVVESVAA